MEIMIIMIAALSALIGTMKYRDSDEHKVVKAVATAIGFVAVTAMIPLGVMAVTSGSAFALLGAVVMLFIGAALLTASMDS